MNLEDRLRGKVSNPSIKHRMRSELDLAEERVRDIAPQAARSLPVRGAVDPYAELKSGIHRACIAKLGPRLFSNRRTSDMRQQVLDAVTEQLEADSTPLTREERRQLILEIANDILGYGPLEPFLADESVTEIMVNGFDRIYVERNGRIQETDSAFADEDHLLRIIDKIVSQVGRRIDEGSPMVDARLPDGSRVNAVVPPLSLNGAVLTIRKFARDAYGMDELVHVGTLTKKAALFLDACVKGKLNILVSGGTGTGKTTLLNALSASVPDHERIITIEDAAELQLQQRHVISLEARPRNAEGEGEIRIRELVVNALRMRPDRIIVGEVRGAETLDMLQAMNTGHEGSLTTIHANSPRDALNRLETLVLMGGLELPLHAIREQATSALDLIVHLGRAVNGARRVTHITEVLGLEGEVITLQDLFVSRAAELRPGAAHPADFLGPLLCTGLQPRFQERLAAQGVALPPEFFLAEETDMPVRVLARSSRRK